MGGVLGLVGDLALAFGSVPLGKISELSGVAFSLSLRRERVLLDVYRTVFGSYLVMLLRETLFSVTGIFGLLS